MNDHTFLQNFYADDTLYLVPTAEQAEVAPGISVAVPTGVVTASTPILPKVSQADTVNEAAINWLGEALKGTYLLFQVTPEAFTQLPHHAFLEKVLAAVGLKTLQVQFGNLSTAVMHNVKQIAQDQQARHILLFGDELTVENLLKLEPYKMYRLDETRFVRVDSLARIEQSTDLKKKLWDVLQKIFLQ